MRFVLLAIVLGFPLIDLYTTVRFARWTGVPVLGVARDVGRRRASTCCATSGLAFRANTVAAMHGEQPLLRGLLDSGRKVLAGVLFLLPGDPQRPDRAGAARAAAQPRPRFRRRGPRPAGRRFTAVGAKALDGEFRRVD